MNRTAKMLFFAITLGFLFTGCASTPKVKEEVVFYPAAPNLPRFQFLASFTGAKDVEGPQSGFEVFVTGIREDTDRVDKPYGVAIFEGKIYVCDTNATVFVFDMEKHTFGPLQGAKGSGKLIQPINISIDKDGTKYVTDPIRGQIVVFDRNDAYLKTLGKPGKWKPVAAVPYEGLVYVADYDNSEIKVFDQKGEMIKRFGGTGENLEGVLDRPVNLAFDREGYLYITDAGRIKVMRYDRDGHFLGSIGKVGTNVGHFQRPRGVAADREDRIYVVDAAYYNVQVFTKEGQNLTFFGEGGTKPGRLILPAGVAIDYDNLKYFEKYLAPNFEPEYLILVTSQFGDRAVNVFAFGKEKGEKYPSDAELLEELKKRLQEQMKSKESPAKGEEDAVQPETPVQSGEETK